MKSELDEKKEQTKEIVSAFELLPPDKAQKFLWMIQGAAVVSEGLKETQAQRQDAVS